ncbi:MAG TPA: hypothetical protein VE954_42620, partial [Oligoflexus sp.]|uniref:hypothetical protein n=1 Tax=Oligoflexus sp. TaxID=1971216 RepID=UPI002D41DDC7
AKAGRSLHTLSRMTPNVSYSSIRRAAQGELEQEQSTVVAIASVVMPETELRSFIKSHYPTLERAVLDVRGPERGHEESSDDTRSASIVEFLKSEDHAKILILANSRTGTTDEEVARKYGENCLHHFEEIKNSGILRYADGSWFFDGSVGNVSLALARKVLCGLAKEFDVKNDSTEFASFSYLLWESLNLEGIKEIYKTNTQHAKAVYDIAQDPKYQGDILLVLGILQNILKGQEGLA